LTFLFYFISWQMYAVKIGSIGICLNNKIFSSALLRWWKNYGISFEHSGKATGRPHSRRGRVDGLEFRECKSGTCARYWLSASVAQVTALPQPALCGREPSRAMCRQAAAYRRRAWFCFGLAHPLGTPRFPLLWEFQ
jgi:hypothetical protein